MLTNIVIAGFAGVLVPLALERAGADPAVASSVFVTMITDSMGFLVFLGLATAIGHRRLTPTRHPGESRDLGETRRDFLS